MAAAIDPARAMAEQSDSSSEDLESRCEVTVRILEIPPLQRTFALPSSCCVADLQAELAPNLDDPSTQPRDLWSTSRGRPHRLGPQDTLQNGDVLVIPSKEDALMLRMLPDRVQAALNPETLVDVALDLGVPPVLHERNLQDNEVAIRELDAADITQEELDAINGHQLLGGRWTSDNRSGVSGTLHRISRNVDPTDGSVVGITIRMAHAQYGMLDQVDALTRSLREKKSLLVLGPPGSGKTTMLREVARLHNEKFRHRVVIVDTSSEIAGFGKVRHKAVGRTTRRRKVADRDKQYKDMLEAVQNDTPQVLVIDEIGSALEVDAACSIGFRGIVLVATAHACSLQEAMNNPTLQPLFGSFEKSTISDETARRTGRKFIEERRNEPVFQSLVELGHDAGDQWTIYQDLKAAIDNLLSKKSPQPIFHRPDVLGLTALEREKSLTEMDGNFGCKIFITGVPKVPREKYDRLMNVLSKLIDQYGENQKDMFYNPEGTETEGRVAVTFQSPDEAEKAVQMLDGCALDKKHTFSVVQQGNAGIYLLCFDGGADRGDGDPSAICPGGAGAVLKQLKAGPHNRGARRNPRTWKMFCPHSSPEQMEYAGLLIGLRGVLDALGSLDPPAERIFVQGDCRFVTDRHGGSQSAEVLRDERSEVHSKLQGLRELVDKALAELRARVEVPDVQWRRRGRNKTADRLTHDARAQKATDPGVRITPGERLLLQGYAIDIPQTTWKLKEAHPFLKISSDFEVGHPQQDRGSGFMGLKLEPQSADGSFSLLVQMEGTWRHSDSFLLGLMAPNSHCLNDAQGFNASDVGYWFSPKSGRVFGPPPDCESDGANFVLPALRDPNSPAARRLLDDSGPTGFRSGARWGITYHEGKLEIYHAVDDFPLQLLEAVTWPSEDFLPRRRFCAVILFKPRAGNGPYRCGLRPAKCAFRLLASAPRRRPIHPGGRRYLPGPAPSLRVCGTFVQNSFLNRSMVDRRAAVTSFLLHSLAEVARQQGHSLQQSTALQRWLLLRRVLISEMAVKEFPWVNKYFKRGGCWTEEGHNLVALCATPHLDSERTDSFFDVLSKSQGIQMRGNTAEGFHFCHPQPARKFEYVMFAPTKAILAVRLVGTWSRQDKALIGFVEQGTDWNSETHPVDLGYFFSLQSQSLLACDGTNFSWGLENGVRTNGRIEDGWAKQLCEQVPEDERWVAERINALTVDSSVPLVPFDVSGENKICVKLTPNFEFEVFTQQPMQQEWVKLGRVLWRSGSELPPGKIWCPAIVFLPRKSMAAPQCAVTVHPKGRYMGGRGAKRYQKGRNPSLEERFLTTPCLHVLDTTGDRSIDMPTWDVDGSHIIWDSRPKHFSPQLGRSGKGKGRNRRPLRWKAQ